MSVKAKVRVNEIGEMKNTSSEDGKRGISLKTLSAVVANEEINVGGPPKVLTVYPKRRVLNDMIPDNELRPRERMLKLLFVVVYLVALSGLGCTLSFYYLFFWDSTMPPVYKPQKKLF